MNLQFDPYSILGVPHNATEDDIKRAYRRLAQRLHPDSNKGNPGASVQFQDVTTAYNLLLDDAKRAAYTEYLKNEVDENDTYFTLRVTPSKRAVNPLDEDQVIYLLAEIFPAPTVREQSRQDARINLTLVLDHSKSMHGPRIERVKVAAQKIIEALTANDYISVVTFNDRANVIIPATRVEDKSSLMARVTMIHAQGGTEIYQGLEAGIAQNRLNFNPRMVNHIILLTDGHTFGDQDRSVALAREAGAEGIGISAMGLGHDWNDDFLDQLASSTGGSTTYINSAGAVVSFMNEQVRNLSNAFAERVKLSVAPDPDIQLEMAFKLAPSPQPLPTEEAYIPLASLQIKRPIMVLLQLQLPANLKIGFRSLVRLVAAGDILQNRVQAYRAVSDVSIEVTDRQIVDEPPTIIMDALSKLTLYRLQERAREALERGDIDEATRRLENLATRLLELGEAGLAHQTLSEAQYISHTRGLSEKGRKTLKYQTRALMAPGGLEAALSSLLTPLADSYHGDGDPQGDSK